MKILKRITRLKRSFSYAFEGVFYVWRTQPNMKIHSVMGTLAIILGFALHISAAEWLALIIVIGFVLILEVINTAVETLVDLYTEEYLTLAKHAKDTAAGAVLLMALVSVAVGCVIFVPKLAALFGII
ncbi:diacylglycerol kinase family protein [Pseudoramibacter alactolyticus]|uniref:diacylglycerol kinase family protein n=1 Tax=Pseudoramibacter alactolyticus TaxID=113287 RepID=UPI00248DAB58|nr:diacylglycerol kinase family protein [Pseudoramibacter alactolyticus]